MAGSDLIELLRATNLASVKLAAEQVRIQSLCADMARNGEVIDDPILDEFQKILSLWLPQCVDKPTNFTGVRLLMMAAEAVQKGRLYALNNLIEAVTDPELQMIDASLASKILHDYGWFIGLTIDQFEPILKPKSPSMQKDDEYARFMAIRVLLLLGFSTTRDIPWLASIMNAVVMPWMAESLNMEYFNAALSIENILAEGWLKCDETMDHYQQSYSVWAGLYEQAGLEKRKSLPPLRTQKQVRPRVGIFVHNASWLAHIQTLYQSFRADTERDYDICLYFLNGKDETLRARFAAINIACCFIEERAASKGFYDRFLVLREQCIKDNVEIMFWLCANIFMGFAFGIGLAPKQIYWCMKHPTSAFKLPDENWFSLNGLNADIELYGINWKIIPTSYLSTSKPDEDAIAAIRGKYPKDAVILGTIGREDKLESLEFLSTVADILDAHPKAVFLYTGRVNLPSISGYFQSRGLEDRVDFIGWIEPRLYAEVFDIYVDSWPARSGMTAFNALEAAKPYVFNVGNTGNHELIATHYFGISLVNQDGVWRIPDPTLDALFERSGERCLLTANGPEEYRKLVARLIEDKNFRHLCQEASLAFSYYLADGTRPPKVINELIAAHLKLDKAKGAA